jgi:hypothetical protein
MHRNLECRTRLASGAVEHFCRISSSSPITINKLNALLPCCRNRQRSNNIKIMPCSAEHFIQAKIKHFDFEEKDQALVWLETGQ